MSSSENFETQPVSYPQELGADASNAALIRQQDRLAARMLAYADWAMERAQAASKVRRPADADRVMTEAAGIVSKTMWAYQSLMAQRRRLIGAPEKPHTKRLRSQEKRRRDPRPRPERPTNAHPSVSDKSANASPLMEVPRDASGNGLAVQENCSRPDGSFAHLCTARRSRNGGSRAAIAAAVNLKSGLGPVMSAEERAPP